MSSDRPERLAQIDEFIETRLPHRPEGDDFQVSKRSGVLIVRVLVSAIVDPEQIDEILHRLRDLTQAGSEVKLVLDLSEVDFVSSGMLGMLISLWRDLQRRNGQLALLVSPVVREDLQMTRLDRAWKVYGTEEEAVAALLADAGTS